jgi:D-alanine-D-alanine ligase
MTSVAILAGGCSFEHEVSLRSARQVVRHLDRRRWRAWPVLLDRDGLWWVGSKPLADDENPDAGFRMPGMRALRPGAAVEHLLEFAGVRVAFPVLHGEGGEDGTVQGMLELHDLPFVGASCAASAVAMDKLRTRECLTYAGVPMARAFVPSTPLAKLTADELARGIEDRIGFPCFLKVDCSGSSIGVARVKGRGDVGAFLDQNRARGGRCLAEAQALGEELTVPVLGNCDDRLEPLPPVGIYPRKGEFFDLESKYADGGADEIVPPRGWSEERIGQVQALALRCHEALRCDGMSRTDMIWTEQGPVVLEVNTIPGLTEASLLPKAARAAGYSFTELVDRLLGLALVRPGHGAKMHG